MSNPIELNSQVAMAGKDISSAESTRQEFVTGLNIFRENLKKNGLVFLPSARASLIHMNISVRMANLLRFGMIYSASGLESAKLTMLPGGGVPVEIAMPKVKEGEGKRSVSVPPDAEQTRGIVRGIVGFRGETLGIHVYDGVATVEDETGEWTYHAVGVFSEGTVYFHPDSVPTPGVEPKPIEEIFPRQHTS